MVVASPTISAGRSPFIASPISTPAICASSARPSMISAIAAAASSLVRSSRRITFAISVGNMSVTQRLVADALLKNVASVSAVFHDSGTRHLALQEIAQDLPALSGQDRLRMELHAVHRKRLVTQSHDRSVLFRSCADFEHGRQPLIGHDERVITRGLEWSAQAAEHAASVVLDRRGLAVFLHGLAHPP